jgi:hypothetical protein
MCHLRPFVYQIPLSKPNRENVYLMELHNAISNQDGDRRNAINSRNVSDVIGGVCIIRFGRDSGPIHIAIRMCCCLLMFAMSDVSTIHLKHRM